MLLILVLQKVFTHLIRVNDRTEERSAVRLSKPHPTGIKPVTFGFEVRNDKITTL